MYGLQSGHPNRMGFEGVRCVPNYFNCCLCKITFLIKINSNPFTINGQRKPYGQHKIKFNVQCPKSDHWFISLKQNGHGMDISELGKGDTCTIHMHLTLTIIWIWFVSIFGCNGYFRFSVPPVCYNNKFDFYSNFSHSLKYFSELKESIFWGEVKKECLAVGWRLKAFKFEVGLDCVKCERSSKESGVYGPLLCVIVDIVHLLKPIVKRISVMHRGHFCVCQREWNGMEQKHKLKSIF